jgi:hypothetical protein
MKPVDALSSLKDIGGVYGSFVVDASGGLTLRDLPAVIDNAALREAGPRIARLWGAFPDDDPPEYVMLEFSSHQVFIRKFEAGSLCVFVPPNVNRLALKMAASFVARWLDAELGAAAVAIEPSPVSEPLPPPSQDASQLGAKKTTYFYRGQRYEG